MRVAKSSIWVSESMLGRHEYGQRTGGTIRPSIAALYMLPWLYNGRSAVTATRPKRSRVRKWRVVAVMDDDK